MKVMKPIRTNHIPEGSEWLYEVKFDGFRCVLHWNLDGVQLISKNNKHLTDKFPEIIAYCNEKLPTIQDFLPLTLDGELVILNNSCQANFVRLQKRRRLKKLETIQKESETHPTTFMAFDIVEELGKKLYQQTLHERKDILEKLCEANTFHTRIQLVPAHSNPTLLWKEIFDYKGEGMIAKRKNSRYSEGKKHQDWFKIKNWRTIQGIITELNVENSYFTVGVFDKGVMETIGKCRHGLGAESFQTLKELFLTKGKRHGSIYTLPPAICAKIHTLDLDEDVLREPEFQQLIPHQRPDGCTTEQLKLDLAMIPKTIELTNISKIFWPENELTKGDLLVHMREIAPYMLPFLKNKALTMIRAPDGVEGETFFQKHLPSYAPEFMEGIQVESDKKVILCNHLEAIVWFANHGTIEYHIPFQKVSQELPDEIVFDLDPPGRERFHIAIEAAKMIKAMLDSLELISFVKTSGNKGLQIHIPIKIGSMTYEQTAIFTKAIAEALVRNSPDLFTIERLKKNRKSRLYIDYVQHGKDKTIIAPYSPRITQDATVATPLYWHEVKEGLTPAQFTIQNVIERVQSLGCPFQTYMAARDKQNFDKVLRMIQG